MEYEDFDNVRLYLANIGKVALLDKAVRKRYTIGESLIPFCWDALDRLGLGQAGDVDVDRAGRRLDAGVGRHRRGPVDARLLQQPDARGLLGAEARVGDGVGQDRQHGIGRRQEIQ